MWSSDKEPERVPVAGDAERPLIAAFDTRIEEVLVQGGVISPLLANLFLHYAFDMWS